MSDDLNLKTTLTSTADTTGATEMSAGLSGVGTAADAVKTQVEELMASLVALFALSELISFFKDASAEAEKLEVAMRGVDSAAGLMNVSTPELREKVLNFSEALGRLGGVMDNEVIVAMSKLLTETGSYEEAAARATLAMRIHTNTAYSFEEALAIVEKTARGQTRGIQQLTGEIIIGTNAHEKATKGLDALNRKFGEMKLTLDDNAGTLEKNRAAWDNFKDTVGGVVLTIGVGLIKEIRAIPEELRFMAALGGEFFRQLAERAGVAANFITGIFKKNWPDLVAEAKAANERIVAEDRAREEKLLKDHEDADKREVAALEAKIAKETTLKTHANKMEEAGDKEVADNAVKLMEEEYRFQMALKRQYEHDLKVGMAAVEALDRKDAAERLRIEKEEHEAELQLDRELQRQRKEIQRAEYETFRQFKRQEYELTADVINGGLELAGEAFGAQKEMAMAEAIIRAALAVESALSAPWPLDLVLPILIAAEAAMQIAKIASTEAPSVGGISASDIGGAGFDDPSNDAAAYAGGRKWAHDMIGKFTGGASSVSQGWAHGMGAVNNNSTSNVTNINVSGGLINPSDKEFMKQFGRKLAIAMQADGQRTVARKR